MGELKTNWGELDNLQQMNDFLLYYGDAIGLSFTNVVENLLKPNTNMLRNVHVAWEEENDFGEITLCTFKAKTKQDTAQLGKTRKTKFSFTIQGPNRIATTIQGVIQKSTVAGGNQSFKGISSEDYIGAITVTTSEEISSNTRYAERIIRAIKHAKKEIEIKFNYEPFSTTTGNDIKYNPLNNYYTDAVVAPNKIATTIDTILGKDNVRVKSTDNGYTMFDENTGRKIVMDKNGNVLDVKDK